MELQGPVKSGPALFDLRLVRCMYDSPVFDRERRVRFAPGPTVTD